VAEARPPTAPASAAAPDKTKDEQASLEALGFPVTDPLETVLQVFRTLAGQAGLPVQDVLLSLPLAFTDRRCAGRVVEPAPGLHGPALRDSVFRRAAD
jgi:hypothetical protein